MKIKKPENWYGFKINCDLYYGGQSNMVMESKQQYCKRGDRPKVDPHRCHWNVCPKLKHLRVKIRGM